MTDITIPAEKAEEFKAFVDKCVFYWERDGLGTEYERNLMRELSEALSPRLLQEGVE